MATRPSSWLQGKTIRKVGGGSASHSRTSVPQIHSTSSTIFGGGVKDPSGRVSEFYSMEDTCPVCKSDRYLNPKLRLLVSSCYHKMCESCIDRLFTLGPAPCPICNKVLRKLAFTPQTFEDLGVEKEVAVRKRIAKEFNKRREDFADLKSYNDYLEEVEDIAFNLINDINLPETEKRIADYRAANAAVIEMNLKREEAEALALKEKEQAARKEREMNAEELRREEEEEKQIRESERRDIIEELQKSNKSAADVIAKSKAAAAKRSEARASSALSQQALLTQALRTRAAQSTVIADLPHVPLQDDWDTYDSLFKMKSDYYDPFSDAVRKDREGVMRGGGYRVEEAWQRALRSAVASLDLLPLRDSSDPLPPMEIDGPDVIMSVA